MKFARNVRKIIYFERIADFISAFKKQLSVREHPMLLYNIPVLYAFRIVFMIEIDVEDFRNCRHAAFVGILPCPSHWCVGEIIPYGTPNDNVFLSED